MSERADAGSGGDIGDGGAAAAAGPPAVSCLCCGRQLSGAGLSAPSVVFVSVSVSRGVAFTVSVVSAAIWAYIYIKKGNIYNRISVRKADSNLSHLAIQRDGLV